MSSPAIVEGSHVTLHFILKMSDGSEVDRTPPDMPANLAIGDGTLPPGFEASLLGLHAGDEREFHVPAIEAFGVREEGNIQRFTKDTFPADMALEEGLIIGFNDPSGNEWPGVVHAIEDAEVVVDFNHPLAGRDLIFDVQILEVREPE